jgi:hypothetical protein
MSNLFLKTFDPFIMNGFKNKKELENYWLFSQIGTGLTCFGLLTLLINELITNTTMPITLFTMSLIAIGYLVIFSFVLAIPFVTNWFFVRYVPDSLTYHYVRYMWANSKSAILVILAELPPEVLREEDLVKLHQNTNDQAQVKLLIKTWHKNFSKELNHKLGKIN